MRDVLAIEPIISPDEIRAYRDENECSMQEAKCLIARDRINEKIASVMNDIRPGYPLSAREVIDLVRLLRIEMGGA